jgi:cell division protein FtsB
MDPTRPRSSVGSAIYFTLAFLAGSYFIFAAVQGNMGLFQRIVVQAEIDELGEKRDRLAAELARLENRTRRMSDDYLDLDLLDQQIRDMLGYLRADEVVIR